MSYLGKSAHFRHNHAPNPSVSSTTSNIRPPADTVKILLSLNANLGPSQPGPSNKYKSSQSHQRTTSQLHCPEDTHRHSFNPNLKPFPLDPLLIPRRQHSPAPLTPRSRTPLQQATSGRLSYIEPDNSLTQLSNTSEIPALLPAFDSTERRKVILGKSHETSLFLTDRTSSPHPTLPFINRPVHRSAHSQNATREESNFETPKPFRRHDLLLTRKPSPLPYSTLDCHGRTTPTPSANKPTFPEKSIVYVDTKPTSRSRTPTLQPHSSSKKSKAKGLQLLPPLKFDTETINITPITFPLSNPSDTSIHSSFSTSSSPFILPHSTTAEDDEIIEDREDSNDPLTPTLLSPITPTTPVAPSEKELRRRRAAKLTRTFGEPIPIELIPPFEKNQLNKVSIVVNTLTDLLPKSNFHVDNEIHDTVDQSRMHTRRKRRSMTLATFGESISTTSILRPAAQMVKEGKRALGITHSQDALSTINTFSKSPTSRHYLTPSLPTNIIMTNHITDIPGPSRQRLPDIEFELVVKEESVVDGINKVLDDNDKAKFNRDPLELSALINTTTTPFLSNVIDVENITEIPVPIIEDGGSSTSKRKEKRQGWSGEWNQENMQDVIQKLRQLR